MQNGQSNNYLGDLQSAASGCANQETPLMSILREYVAAKERFDNACVAFSKISQEKLEAETVLRALSEKVNAIVADGLFDPMVQRPAEPASTQLKGFGGPKSY